MPPRNKSQRNVTAVTMIAVLWYCVMGCVQAQTDPMPTTDVQSGSATRLAGTFIQLTAEHGTWQRIQWYELFLEFERLGLRHIVIQWTAYDDLAFFPSSSFRNVPNPPLEMLLQLADEFGFRVRVGLSHDSQYWREINHSPSVVQVYLGRRILAMREILPELLAVVRKHRSFAGFYVAEEIDDVSWQAPERQAVLFSYLRALRNELRRNYSPHSIAISGFSNAATSPRALANFWDSLFRTTGISVLLFQDGIGAGKLELPELRIYLEALRGMFDDSRRELWIVVELFQLEAGTNTATRFQAVPAHLQRIKRQLALAAEYTTTSIAFSVPDYMSPSRGTQQGGLFNAYADDLNQ